MESVSYYLKIPAVRFGFQFLIWGFLLTNILMSLSLLETQKDLQNKKLELDKLTSQQNTLENQSKYWQSSLYLDKFAKNNNFSLPGEEVVSTSNIESKNDNPSVYFPDSKNLESNNLEIWYSCLFTPLEAQADNINSACS